MIIEDNTEVVPLFPTPLFKTIFSLTELGETIQYLNNTPMIQPLEADSVGSYSKNTYILDEKECTPLSELIIGAVRHFAKKILFYAYEDYAFSQSWVSHKHPGQSHKMHTHPNSLISGVFYFGEEDPQLPAITFHKLVTGMNASYLSPVYQPGNRTSPYAQDAISVNYTPGMLLLFPSYVFHSVPVNRIKKIRKSLSFNVLPRGKIGRNDGLTEMMFQRFI